MSDRDTFGPRLRRERERRGISLQTIASVTKVGVELWEGLERNDFSRWPSGIFARAFVRDYSLAVGLDPNEVIDEFCRLFPVGDRRSERLIKAHGELIGHPVAPDTSMIPRTGDRRAANRRRSDSAPQQGIRLQPRAVAAGVDTAAALAAAMATSVLLQTNFWAAAGAIGLAYYGISTVLLGATPGTRVVNALRQRIPALFVVQDRRRAQVFHPSS